MIERRWLDAGPDRLHARVAGSNAEGTDGTDSPPVVLVHGLGMSSRYFVPLLQALGTTHHTLAPDLPGFGRSPAPSRVLDIRGLAEALEAFLAAADLVEPVLVANSLGCQVAAELAATGRPVRALVLVGPTADRSARTRPRQVTRLLADVPHEPASLLGVVARAYLQAGPRTVLGTASAALHHPVEERVAACSGPVVVIRGEHDPIAPRGWCQELASRAPGGRFVEVLGAAHAAHYSHPEVIASIVREQLPGPGTATAGV